MRAHTQAAALMIIVLVGAAACDGSDSSCDNVRGDLQTSIATVCTSTDYIASPFCTTCVTHGYFAISDACQCQPLTFDTDFCYAPSDNMGMGAVENAVDAANQSCPSPTLPYRDAATDGRIAGDAGGGTDGSAG